MKYPENMLEVATLAPDYMGFIFYEKSSRFFNGAIPQLPEHIKKVGVFVNASEETILQTVQTHQLDMVQLHGEESVAFCQALVSLLTITFRLKRIEIIKVFSVGDDFDFEVVKPFETVCDFFLFDTKGKLPGGNGFTFNWNLLENYPSTKPYFLSGGIGLEHAEALEIFRNNTISKHCHAIDVNSQFEVAPGLKNKEKLQQLKNTL
jgi:phosphoribosylanthranilate isomerase